MTNLQAQHMLPNTNYLDNILPQSVIIGLLAEAVLDTDHNSMSLIHTMDILFMIPRARGNYRITVDFYWPSDDPKHY